MDGTILEVLRRKLALGSGPPDERLEFAGGYVGYLGYELKADLGSPGRHVGSLPDACLIGASAFVVLDHVTGKAHAVRVVAPDESLADAEEETRRVRDELTAIGDCPRATVREPTETVARPDLDADAYRVAIAEAQRRLRAGDAYELCLTNRFAVEIGDDADPLDLYLELRKANPAPRAGYLRFGDAALLSASPERFLGIDPDRRVVTSPIKGTRPRGSDPASDRVLRDELRSSAKERAENVMIVDVLRNDLGRVCGFGSIEVDRLAEVETFARIHQLVSTISGRLAPGCDAVDCVEACFPGGSMTGAPKLKAMEIIDSLESSARGPYSGAFGWFGLDGQVDLSIVIRSIVLGGGDASVGAGGAITIDSDPEEEYEEMLLKARPLLAILGAELAPVDGR